MRGQRINSGGGAQRQGLVRGASSSSHLHGKTLRNEKIVVLLLPALLLLLVPRYTRLCRMIELYSRTWV